MPQLSIVDTHAHLDGREFDEDREAVIDRARDADVGKIVTIGVDIKSSRAAINLAQTHPGIWATVAVHPLEAGKMTPYGVDELAELAVHPRVTAIGEIGLDFHRDRVPREPQFQALEWQLELAAKAHLPVVIHCRDADADMLRVLRGWIPRSLAQEERPVGVIHCFSGDLATAQRYLDMGFFLSLAGYISYPTSRHAHDVIRGLPLDRLVVETDCPYFSPQELRGRRCEPAYLALTVGALAEIRGIDVETVARETTENAHRLFRLEPR